MISGDRDALIQRYISNKMNSMERHEFQIQMMLDNDLARTVETLRAIDGALGKDRAAELHRQPDIRSAVMAMSAAQVVAELASAPTPQKWHGLSSPWLWSALTVLVMMGGTIFLLDNSRSGQTITPTSSPIPDAAAPSPPTTTAPDRHAAPEFAPTASPQRQATRAQARPSVRERTVHSTAEPQRASAKATPTASELNSPASAETSSPPSTAQNELQVTIQANAPTNRTKSSSRQP